MKGSLIQIVVPYWEMRPAHIERRLDRLQHAGIQSIATFVPWAHFEKDIAHTLRHFLLSVAERKMKLTLWAIPEAGLSLENSSIPKDLQSKQQSQRDWNHIDTPALPDPFSGEVVKRLLAHLRKVQSVIADVSRQVPGFDQWITLAISGGYWSTMQPDRARSGLTLEQAESRFRQKCAELLGPSVSTKLCVPELDPEYKTAAILSRLVGGRADLSKLMQSLDRAAFRAHAHGLDRSLWTYWGRGGSFRTLSDAEKQCLILTSAMHGGASGGGVLVEDSDWLQLSSSFRSKAEWFAQWQLKSTHRVGVLTAHAANAEQRHIQSLKQAFGQDLCLLVDDRAFVQSLGSKLLWVDATAQVTVDQVERWSLWVQSGRTLVMSSAAMLDPMARAWVDQCFAQAPVKMDLQLGARFQIAHIGEGKWVWLDAGVARDGAITPEFIDAMAKLSQHSAPLEISQEGIRWAMFRCGEEAGHALFVCNALRKPVQVRIKFAREVEVTDLFTRHAAKREHELVLEVPPFGMLPLFVSGLDHVDVERWIAARDAGELRTSVDAMAAVALEGFDWDQTSPEMFADAL